MKRRVLGLAVVPAVLLGPCGPSECQPPPGAILDLQFACRYPDGIVDFTVDNLSGVSRSYVAYDADSGFRLTDSTGAYDFSIGPGGSTIQQFSSEFELARVAIAPPGLAPGDVGYSPYDTEVVGTTTCVTDD